MKAKAKVLQLVTKAQEVDANTVEILEAVLERAKAAEFETILMICFQKDGSWTETHTAVMNTSEKIGILTRLIHSLLRELDG